MLAINPQYPSLCPTAISSVGMKTRARNCRNNKFLAHQDVRDTSFPSCRSCKETCNHIMWCPEDGHHKAFQQLVAELSSWMTEDNTHPKIKAVVIIYALGRDNVSLRDYPTSYPAIIQDYTSSQDKIGGENS
jgi:hypothetical protein